MQRHAGPGLQRRKGGRGALGVRDEVEELALPQGVDVEPGALRRKHAHVEVDVPLLILRSPHPGGHVVEHRFDRRQFRVSLGTPSPQLSDAATDRPAHDETLLLPRYLDRARAAVLRAVEGVGEHDLRRPMTPTGATLLGVVKHLATVEIGYVCERFDRELPASLPWWPPERRHPGGQGGPGGVGATEGADPGGGRRLPAAGPGRCRPAQRWVRRNVPKCGTVNATEPRSEE